MELNTDLLRAWGWLPPEQPALGSFAAQSQGGIPSTAQNPQAALLTQAATQAALGKVDEMKATARKNKLAGFAADALKYITDFADTPDPRAGFGGQPQNPPLAIASGLLGLPALQRTLDRYSYGEPLTNAGKANVPLVPADTADAAMAVAPVVAKWPRQAAGALGMLAGGGGDMSRAATVFHGTPHKFDAFDASKIGTGEGAQFYGHGIYVAENPSVAKTYMTAGLDDEKKEELISKVAEKIKQAAFESEDKKLSLIRKFLPDSAYRQEAIGALQRLVGSQRPISQDNALGAIADHVGNDMVNIYKVHLPDEKINNMLDWFNGGEDAWYSAIDQAGTPAAAAELLRSKGYTGIKYLDSGSRQGGHISTRNFVVFPGEESSMKIIERNGKAVE